MRVILTTGGSTGDVQPLIALAVKLKEAGHFVKVCSHAVHKERIEGNDVPFAAVGHAVDMRTIRDVIYSFNDPNPPRQLGSVVDYVLHFQGKQYYVDCLAEARGFDLAVCHCMDFLGQHAMIENNIPWFSVVLFPGIIPALFCGPLGYPNLGRAANYLMWKFLNAVTTGYRRKVEEFLLSLGGITRRIQILGTFSPYLNLVACSAFVGKTYPDLPNNFVVTGAWHREEKYEPTNELATFIANSRPDVIFTFGSVCYDNGAEIGNLLFEAAKLLQVRAIIQRGWGNIRGNDSSDHVLFTDYIPHDYLFQQAKVVVHHGGAGTTMAVCKAGVASVVVPHFGDQAYWGNTLCRLGVANKPIPRRSLTPSVLAREIERTLNSQAILQNARSLASRIAVEQGTNRALEQIENSKWLKTNGGYGGDELG